MDLTTEVALFQYAHHIFGSKHLPTCANCFFQRTATDNQSKVSDATESVCNKFYLDDFLKTSHIVEQVTPKGQDFARLLNIGRSTLTKFVTNVPICSPRIQCDSKSTDNDIEVLSTFANYFYLLGVKWNHQVDTLVVSCKTSPDSNDTIRQRVAFSVVSSIYNLIGLVAPHTVKTCLLLKEILILGRQGKDNDLRQAIVTQFLEWRKDFGC